MVFLRRRSLATVVLDVIKFFRPWRNSSGARIQFDRIQFDSIIVIDSPQFTFGQ